MPGGSAGDSTATSGTTSARCPALDREPIDLDQPDAALRDLAPRSRGARRRDRPTRPRRRESRARSASAWPATRRLAVTVVVLRDLRWPTASTSSIGWLNHFSVLLRISSLPTMSTRTRRHDRQPEEGQHELGAEARERQPAAPLDEELDDVARQHEDERDEHRQVGGGQRVEDDLAQEVGVELGRAGRRSGPSRRAPR